MECSSSLFPASSSSPLSILCLFSFLFHSLFLSLISLPSFPTSLSFPLFSPYSFIICLTVYISGSKYNEQHQICQFPLSFNICLLFLCLIFISVGVSFFLLFYKVIKIIKFILHVLLVFILIRNIYFCHL